ncbi:hypothetical protein BH20GEM2_BH20GEM2_19620 [soil metagenome]
MESKTSPLTGSDGLCMVFHMKTTLIIPDPVFRELKRRAVERGETMSNLVTEFLRRGLAEKPKAKELPPLPVFHGMGEPLVDISNSEELYEVLDGERDARLYGRRDPG